LDENEQLKSKLLSTQELKRDLDTKVLTLERENVNLESQVRNYESKVSSFPVSKLYNIFIG
jgi:hypothetical protein